MNWKLRDRLKGLQYSHEGPSTGAANLGLYNHNRTESVELHVRLPILEISPAPMIIEYLKRIA